MPPPFDPRIRLLPEVARQDQIRITLGSWLLQDVDHAGKAAFLGGLNPTSTSICDDSGEIILPGRIFILPSDSTSLFAAKSIDIVSQQSSRIRQPNRPLFSGNLDVFEIDAPDALENSQSVVVPASTSPDDRTDRFDLRLQFNLQINPTRFVHHQGYIPRIFDLPGDWNFPPPRLCTGGIRQSSEHTLDDSDNVIYPQRMESNARSTAWPLHLDRYWNAIHRTFNYLFLRSARVALTSISWAPRFSLKYVETYWEFSSSDPLGLVRRLEPHLMAFASAGAPSFARDYQDPSRGTAGNAPSLRIQLRRGIFLRVYAKTNARIRFEVSHDLAKSRRHPIGGYQRETLDSFRLVLNFCAEVAAELTNQVMEFLARYQGADLGRESAYSLVYRISREIDSMEDGEIILGILVNNGGRIVLAPNDRLRDCVDRLIDAGILGRVASYSQTFCVAPGYITAIAQLRGQARWRIRTQ